MSAEPGRLNELSAITRVDAGRTRPVQTAAGCSFIEPGSPVVLHLPAAAPGVTGDERRTLIGPDTIAEWVDERGMGWHPRGRGRVLPEQGLPGGHR